MAKKKNVKIKEPIKVRFKELANGNKSIYLDIYYNGVRKYDMLKLYIVPEINESAKINNINTMMAVNAIKAQRMTELINGTANIKERKKVLLLDWLEQVYKTNNEKHRGRCYTSQMNGLKIRLTEFLGKKANKFLVSDVDVMTCKEFIAFCRKYTYSRPTKKEGVKPIVKKLAPNTINFCFNRFSEILDCAVDADLIEFNPTKKLKTSDRPKMKTTERTYLTKEELKSLLDTQCSRDDVRRLFLFGCFTGLRYSDILGLKWGDIIEANGNYYYNLTMKKTQGVINNMISSQALLFMPERETKKDDEKVFNITCRDCTIGRVLKNWAKSAGIKKNVTFHTSRHTFATIILAEGASLYTVKELLGHKSITSTQVYAKVIDKTKDDAIKLLDNIF